MSEWLQRSQWKDKSGSRTLNERTVLANMGTTPAPEIPIRELFRLQRSKYGHCFGYINPNKGTAPAPVIPIRELIQLQRSQKGNYSGSRNPNKGSAPALKFPIRRLLWLQKSKWIFSSGKLNEMSAPAPLEKGCLAQEVTVSSVHIESDAVLSIL